MKRFRFQLKKNAKKKNNNSSSKPLPYKKVLFVFLPLLIAIIIFTSFYTLYIKSPYFVVRNVVMVGKDTSSSVNYADLERMMIEKNIFRLNLKNIREYMLNNYQELLGLELKRAFPDSIIATIILRKPVAQLYQKRYYPVDEDCVLLSGVKDYPDEKLPIINGVRFNPSREIGKTTDSKHVKKALLLLKELCDSGILEEHTLVEIDVSSLRNVIFFLEDGLEVKIGREDYTTKLENLREVLADPKLKPRDIRYIDLRFKEPVIGPKWKR